MGRGVSAGGGQSSLGYLFGSGEAPKSTVNNTEAPPKQVPDASNGASQRSTTPTSEPPADITKQIPAGIQGSQANNYFRADGQNSGNFITKDMVSKTKLIDNGNKPKRKHENPRKGIIYCRERPSTKVHSAPGGGSSLGYLFGDGK